MKKKCYIKPYFLHGTVLCIAFISSQKLQKVTVIENVQHLNTILIYSQEKKNIRYNIDINVYVYNYIISSTRISHLCF